MRRLWLGSLLGLFALTLLVGCGGDPIDQIVDHQKSILKIIKDNMDNADEAIKKVKDYVTEHKDEMKELAEQLEDMKKDMNEEEMMEKMTELMAVAMETVSVMAEFCKKHPEKAADLQKEMDAMD